MLAALFRERKMFTSPLRMIESLPRHRWRTTGAIGVGSRGAGPTDELRGSTIHQGHIPEAHGNTTARTGDRINNTHPLGIQTCAEAMGYQGICGSRRNYAMRPPRGFVRRPHR